MPTRPDDEVTMGPTLVRPARPSGYAPGAVVAGRYRLVGLLGRGGMGEVYRADDLTLDQPVALKFLPDGVAADDIRLAQFHNELRVARQVSHKNVCRLYDLGDADAILSPRATIADLVPLEKPPAVLADRAQQILAEFGYAERPGDTAERFIIPPDFRLWLVESDTTLDRWNPARHPMAPGLLFWYRTSPRDLEPSRQSTTVSATDPPMVITGRVSSPWTREDGSWNFAACRPSAIHRQTRRHRRHGARYFGPRASASPRSSPSRPSGSRKISPTRARRGKGRCRTRQTSRFGSKRRPIAAK